MNESPAPMVSATVTAGAAIRRRAPREAIAHPEPPSVTAASVAPAASSPSSTASTSRSGQSHAASSSLHFTTSASARSGSRVASTASRSGVIDGRTFGSRDSSVPAGRARTASSTVAAPGCRTAPIDPTCTSGVPSGTSTGSIRQSRSNSYEAPPSAAIVATAVDVRGTAVASTRTPLASTCARTAAPRSSSPSAQTSRAGRPSRARPTATFIGLPPGCSDRPSGRSTTSTRASPSTMTLLMATSLTEVRAP